MRYNRTVVLALAAVAFACKGDTGTGPSSPTYETIAGTYAGSMAGTSQGVLLQANFTLTVSQTTGNLGGSYSIAGTLSDGVTTVPMQGTGSVAGSIASGGNPSVNLTVTSGVCSNVRDTFSGAYDSVNRVITLTGPVDIFNASCQVVLTYANSTIILRR